MRDDNGYELITGATIASLLYGQGDFIKTIQTGLNFGWDCDNTTATLGTILGVRMGYKKMMSQGWKIVDRYKNTTRDGMPEDETITSFADRIFELMEKMVVENGGRRVKREDRYFFQIPVEEALMVENLPELDNQIRELAHELRSEIETEILEASSKEALSRAAYLGICLDLDRELSGQYPGPWQEAKDTFEECWKLKQLIYYNGNFPSIIRIREKFLKAGIEKPENQLDLQIIWLEDRICLPPDEAMALKINN
jgi:hypothetical protein